MTDAETVPILGPRRWMTATEPARLGPSSLFAGQSFSLLLGAKLAAEVLLPEIRASSPPTYQPGGLWHRHHVDTSQGSTGFPTDDPLAGHKPRSRAVEAVLLMVLAIACVAGS